VETSLLKAEAGAKRAIQLDPKIPDGYTALGQVQRGRGKYLLAVDTYSRALALDPDNPDLLNSYSDMLSELGYLKQALPLRQRLEALEPFVPVFHNTFARLLWVSGQTDAAIALNKSPPGGGGIALAAFYASQGRYAEAADVMQSVRGGDPVFSGQREAAARLLRTAPAAAASPKTLPRFGALGWVYLYVGAPDRVLEYYEGNIKIGLVGSAADIIPLWAPSYAPVRKMERFKAYVRAAGMVDYWRARGWPDHCRPMGADDFVCD
jgi:adenylate cyclase